MTDTLKAIKGYFESEYKDLVRYAENPDPRMKVADVANATMQRCLGASFFAQALGANYEDIDKIYMDYWTKINKIKNA